MPLLANRVDATWVAAAISTDDRAAVEAGTPTPTGGVQAKLLALDSDVSRLHYDVISNGVLWFLHHGLFDLARRPRFDRHFREAWEGYVSVNRSFTDAVIGVAGPDETVLVQDYQLTLVPQMLAEARPDLRVVHFTHTPFCGPSSIRVLPEYVAHAICSSMATSTSGFHTERWARAFRASVHEVLGSDAAVGRTFAASFGPDPAVLAAEISTPEVVAEIAALEERVGDRQLIVRSDRMELSKNIVRGFLSYDLLLEEHPELRERVTFAALLNPSRDSLPEYQAYRNEVEHRGRSVNDRWATAGWEPVILDERDNYAALVGRAGAQRRSAGESGTRRTQPRRTRRPARESARRCPVPLTRSGRVRRASPFVPERAAVRSRADGRGAARSTDDGSGRACRTARRSCAPTRRPTRLRPGSRRSSGRPPADDAGAEVGEEHGEPGWTLDVHVGALQQLREHLPGTDADPDRMGEPAGRVQAIEAVERGQIAGVVTGEGGRVETVTELFDHGSLVHRHRRAELRGHPGRVELETGQGGRLPRPLGRSVPQLGSRPPVQHHGHTVLALDPHSRQLPGRGNGGCFHRREVGLDPRVRDHAPIGPTLHAVLPHVRHAVEVQRGAQEADRPTAHDCDESDPTDERGQGIARRRQRDRGIGVVDDRCERAVEVNEDCGLIGVLDQRVERGIHKDRATSRE